MLGWRNHNGQSKIVGAFLLLAVIAFCACENDISKVQDITGDGTEIPIETAEGLEVLYSDSAKIKARVQAQTMNRFEGEEPRIEMPDGVLLIFYDENLEESSRLTANRAVNKIDEGIMEAFENVVVLNEQGERLDTEYLKWEERSGMLRSDKFVKITTEEQIIYGDGFEAEQDFSSYRIFKTKGIINVKDTENE